MWEWVALLTLASVYMGHMWFEKHQNQTNPRFVYVIEGKEYKRSVHLSPLGLQKDEFILMKVEIPNGKTFDLAVRSINNSKFVLRCFITVTDMATLTGVAKMTRKGRVVYGVGPQIVPAGTQHFELAKTIEKITANIDLSVDKDANLKLLNSTFANPSLLTSFVVGTVTFLDIGQMRERN